MTQHLIRSWAYAWASQGGSAKTMSEMKPFMVRFTIALDRPLQTATRGDCEEFIGSHASPFRANFAWRSLRSFYGWLAEEEETISPMAKVKAPKVPLTDVSVATEDDVCLLLRAWSPWRTFENSRDAAIISLLWATGLRRSELAALRLDDLDLDTQTLIVRQSKNGKSRRVPFDDRATQHVLRYLGKREAHTSVSRPELWLGTKGVLGSDGIRQVVERRRKLCGVTISCHSMRRGLAARALRKGVSQSSLMVNAGWVTPTMVTRYTRTVASDIARAEYRRVLG